jgi:hypothetical protein
MEPPYGTAEGTPPIVGMEGPGPEPTITLILKDGTTRTDNPMAQLYPARN